MTTPQHSDLNHQIKLTNIIYYSLLSGLIIFFVIVMVLIQNGILLGDDVYDKIFVFIVPIFGLIMMFFSRIVYTQMLTKFNSGGSIIQKIIYYRTAKIVSWAMIEGACFFALVATMLTSNYLYVAVYIFLFGYFFLMRPSKESLVRDMRLNSEENELILKS